MITLSDYIGNSSIVTEEGESLFMTTIKDSHKDLVRQWKGRGMALPTADITVFKDIISIWAYLNNSTIDTILTYSYRDLFDGPDSIYDNGLSVTAIHTNDNYYVFIATTEITNSLLGEMAANINVIHNSEYPELTNFTTATASLLIKLYNTLGISARITENEGIIKDTYIDRFKGAPWYDIVRTFNIIVGGCGGISSNFLYLLSRLNVNHITVYDDDTVESHNLGGQFFSIKDIGDKKVLAIQNKINVMSDYYKIISITEKYTSSCNTSNIMICGFDNMTARNIFYNNWKRDNKGEKNSLFIDGRLLLEKFQVLCIRGDDEDSMKRYENEWLFADQEIEEEGCTVKQTSYSAVMIASIMCNLLINYADTLSDEFKRALPFVTEYNALTMNLKTEV